jgi:hypothetical protein
MPPNWWHHACNSGVDSLFAWLLLQFVVFLWISDARLPGMLRFI